ncbi:DUF6473 family protein [Cereibacter changlensis]|uniref:DUF6473 domain-containing protein n=1 Tax=Cereibacter changlensis TaxID=402884 RepID=A0A2W7S6V8_9RHOB|nr:DUF6473 family protein [Cereibacter changlensis]PZX58635.1 hypothetical protein LX76_00137 [Cereibacter changlensis]
MAFEYPGAGALDYFPCRYGKSKLLFRGPRRDLDGRFCAVLGGTETYGKFLPRPYPALVEAGIGLRMVNLGCVSAGVDVYLQDQALLDLAGQAHVVLVQVLGAANLTNPFYAVHPRRNDRFLRAAPELCTLFREVDFADFHFTRHMLQTLQTVSPEKFEVLARALRATWITRMRLLLARIGGRSLLVWIADQPPPPAGSPVLLTRSPVLVDADMLAEVQPFATAYVECVSSPEARAAGRAGMVYAPLDELAATELPGPAVHAEIAARLMPALQAML